MVTNTGIKPYLAKIQGILDIPAPDDVLMLQSFLNMSNFLQPFILQMSHHADTLRALPHTKYLNIMMNPSMETLQPSKP